MRVFLTLTVFSSCASTHKSGVIKDEKILCHHRGDCLFLHVIHFRVKEEVFWKNYFYRVSLIKQSAQLTALAAQQAAERRDGEKPGTGPEAVHQKGKTVTPVFNLNALISEKQIINFNS